MRTVFAALTVTLAAGTAAAASLGTIPGEERFKGLAAEDAASIGGSLTFGQIEEDFYIQLTPRFDLNLGKFGLGLQVPLNLRVINNDPKEPSGVLRPEDWDEFGDFFKFIRYLRFGHKRDFIYFQMGEIAGKIGHGTIMNGYMNNLDMDSFRLGVGFDLNTDYAGFETVFGDFPMLFSSQKDSKIIGIRTYVKPVAFADASSMFNIFQVGVSFVGDFTAPYSLNQVTADPALAPCDPTTRVNCVAQVDGDNNFVVTEDRDAIVWGFDLDIELLRTYFLDVTPYADFNFVHKGGFGTHIGVDVMFKIPAGIDLNIPIKLEYQRFGSDYIPTYFGAFYEIERYQYPVGGANPKTKRRYVEDLPGGEGLNGFYGDLALDFMGFFQIGAVYQDYEGSPGGNLSVFLSVPALEQFQFKAYYSRVEIQGASDIFSFDERSMIVVQGRVKLVAYLYLIAQWSRRWVLEPNGRYDTKDEWNAGIDFALDL